MPGENDTKKCRYCKGRGYNKWLGFKIPCCHCNGYGFIILSGNIDQFKWKE